MPFAAILLPRAVDAPFDYAIPAGMTLVEGSYVQVPVGRQQEWGVVWQLIEHSNVPPEKIKSVLQVSSLPPMQATMRRFIERVADYTLSARGNVLAMAMRVPRIFEKPLPFQPKGVITSPSTMTFSQEQQKAIDTLREAMAKNTYAPFLLDGITGSGKTEVYAEAIAAAIASGKQALVLLPEIILTEPLIARLRARLGVPVISWHSGLTPKQRAERWQAIVNGEAPLVVGARSALFLPYAKLGLIVVDEEHEHSFKQEDGVLYHGRDMAVLRAHMEGFPIVLVSATPSLETETNCRQERYERLVLRQRHADATLPEIRAIDMRACRLDAKHFVSPELVQALQTRIHKQEQSILFLNRRGYAPLTLCRACGHRLKCPNCSTWLVEHRHQRKLQCHHCGYHGSLPKHCPECKAEDSLHPVGPGVERLQEELKELLPDARTLLFTSDHIGTAKVAEAALKSIENGEVDIIIGTQMIAKGHHFPNLTLVGVVDADLGLEGGDLRAAEKSFQMLHQVSGRAGRADKKGEVLLQTYQTDHPVMQALLAGDRDQFLTQESSARQMAGVPPFGRFAAVILSGKEEEVVRRAAVECKRVAPARTSIQILGPAPAPLTRLKGKFRYRLLVRAPRSVTLQPYLREWQSRMALPASIGLKVDVDPYYFL